MGVKMGRVNITRQLYACLVAGTLLLIPAANADTLRIPENQAASDQRSLVAVPEKGMSKAQVEARFGMPDSRHGPTGNPPIYYWEYSEFTVYFEQDYVIHTVRKYK